MQTIYSAEFMQDNCGCYKEEKGKLELMILKGRKEITYLDIIESGIPLKDKYWFFCEKIFTKEQNQQVAIIVAEIVLPIYEEKCPENKVPREAIEAAKLYVKGEITFEQLLIKRRAASASARGRCRRQALSRGSGRRASPPHGRQSRPPSRGRAR